MADIDKPHYLNHRKRLRERFRRSGFEGFQPYEALELLLTFAIPRRDVKPLAKQLLDRFGSFQGVLDAPYDELSAFPGLGENSATFLVALKEGSALYLKDRLTRKDRRTAALSSTAAVLDYCAVKMSSLRDEQFRALFLNARNEVIADEVIQEGTVDQSVVYPRKVMERALHHKAAALIFVHNHPSGHCSPSDHDLVLTAQLIQIARDLGLAVHDHIIIGKSGHYSFLEHGLMNELRRPQLKAADTRNPKRPR